VSDKRSNLINVGRLTGVFGIKGWLKVTSNTEPKENIVNYSPWWVKTQHGVKALTVDEFNFRPQGLVVHFKDIDDRDLASGLAMADIAIEKEQLAKLGAEDYYWHQLIGLEVVSEFEGAVTLLGTVAKLMETGANDVLAVSPSDTSVDDRERLIPYVPGNFVLSVDLSANQIRVNWDPEF